MRFMGVKGDYEYYEDDNGNIHKLKKLDNERSIEFRDFPRGIVFNKVKHDFGDNFKPLRCISYGNDKLMNGLKSKKSIKLIKKRVKKTSYGFDSNLSRWR